VPWLHNQSLSDMHYKNVWRDLQVLNETDPSRYSSMHQTCEEYGDGSDPNWCVTGIWAKSKI
jgi:hypothetical protein